jgi:hypothetical protein
MMQRIAIGNCSFFRSRRDMPPNNSLQNDAPHAARD